MTMTSDFVDIRSVNFTYPNNLGVRPTLILQALLFSSDRNNFTRLSFLILFVELSYLPYYFFLKMKNKAFGE